MEANSSVLFFLRFLNERLRIFRDSLTNFKRKLVMMDHGEKIAAARSLLQSIDDLKRAISEGDRPAWISTLENQVRHYTTQHQSNADAALSVLNAIVQATPEIDAQKWDFEAPSGNSAIDFSTIFREAYRASRIRELLDELIGHIQTIVESGAIDSIRVLKSLEELVALIRKNRQGDIFSTGTLWEITKKFFLNLSFEGLESIPVVKQTVKAIRKTMADLDLEMGQLYGSVKQKLVEKTSTQLTMLEYTPSQQLSLPAPQEVAPPDGQIGPEKS